MKAPPTRDRLLCRRAQSRRRRIFRARDHGRVSRHSRTNGSRSWCSSRSPRWALGAFAAIGQRNIKRLMAYSSIGHMGFALVGLAAGTAEGVQGVLVYMAIYVAMTLGVFAVILSMRRDGKFVETIGDLAGPRAHPSDHGVLSGDAVVLARGQSRRSPGFSPKFYVFLAAIKAGLYMLA